MSFGGDQRVMKLKSAALVVVADVVIVVGNLKVIKWKY